MTSPLAAQDTPPLHPGLRLLSRVGMVIVAFPAPLLVLLAIVTREFGAAFAKPLFGVISIPTFIFLRTAISALILWRTGRPSGQTLTWWDWRWPIFLGAWNVFSNMIFYESLKRIPLGVALGLDFAGPLGLALIGSRTLLDVVWTVLAGLGVGLLTPIGAMSSLDPLGVVLALLAAVCWAVQILTIARISREFPGISGLPVVLLTGAILTLPLAIPELPQVLGSLSLLARSVFIALLSATIPASLDFITLRRVTPRVYGILVSSEPVIAALIGMLVLDERLGPTGFAALILISIASIGVTLYGRRGAR